MFEVLSVLAIHKLTIMLMDYAGPFGIFDKLREATKDFRGVNWDCLFCFSTLVSLPFAIYLAAGVDIIIYWFGLAGAVWFVNLIHERLQ